MKVFVTGTRGIPDIPGGVESHCQNLYPLVVEAGHEVLLCRRSAYIDDKLERWQGVELVDVHSPQRKSLEAIVHTFLAILAARKWGADVVHVHAVGPSLVIPVARVLGMKVVMTNHGPDYDRQKWGKAAKAILMLGEYLGSKFANEIIVISQHIRDIVQRRCGKDSTLIPNGVVIPTPEQGQDFLDQKDLEPGKYLLAVARLVPEKGLHDLISAFEQAQCPWKLVIVGDADHEDDYSRSLKQQASGNPDILLTGYLTGEPLRQLFSHAGLFVMPSYHEGLPIALLEAMSYGLPVLASNIPANVEVELEDEAYFPCGNTAALAEKLTAITAAAAPAMRRQEYVNRVREKYDWVTIAQDTISVYNRAVSQ